MDVIGYHGTREKFRYSIRDNGLDPAKVNYRRDHWLGQGVYFFGDYEKALWWAQDISSKHRNEGALVYQAELSAPDQEVLNLDDNKQLDQFLTEIIGCINEMEPDEKGRVPVFDDSKLRAVFFDYYKQEKNISIIIATFPKEAIKYGTTRTPNDLDTQKKIMRIIHLQFKEKQICVSKKDCIKSTRLIYDEKEEVI